MLHGVVRIRLDDIDSVDPPEAEPVLIPTTQIQLEPEGKWHRRGPQANETACGIVFAGCHSREYELEGPLCDECWTKHERFLAADTVPPKEK